MMRRKVILFLASIYSLVAVAQTTIYTNDMDYVLGDVKQAFIKDKITSGTDVLMLLKGFEAMKVNGIRIPIFAKDHVPNKPALDYFYTEAVKAGFDIFANPVHWNGGQRVANNFFEPTDEFGGTVKNDPVKTQNLIDRILEFDSEYSDIKWINPFNEDGSTGSTWSASQMNTLYSTLSEELVNSELIGSCPWGIPAAIDVIKNTDIADYITVSTAHNLGFNHTSWTEFIELSDAAGLPVWDSEVNNNQKYEDKSTRLEAALEYGVDGLVLYDSWSFIDLDDGTVSSSGQAWMEMYLKSTSLEEIENKTPMFDVFSESQGLEIHLLDESVSKAVTVINISGKTVFANSNVQETVLYIDNLNQGVYIVQVQSQGEFQQEKVIVM